MAQHEQKFRNHRFEADTLHARVLAIPPEAAKTVIELLHALADLLSTEHADHVARAAQRDQASARITNIRRLAAALLEATDPDRDALADQYELPLDVVDAWIKSVRPV